MTSISGGGGGGGADFSPEDLFEAHSGGHQSHHALGFCFFNG